MFSISTVSGVSSMGSRLIATSSRCSQWMSISSSRPLNAIQAELIARGFEVTEHAHSINAQMKGSNLRIQFTIDLRYQAFLADAKIKSVLGEDVPVASLENIVKGKVWAWNDPRRLCLS